jgi:hypothetical protein
MSDTPERRIFERFKTEISLDLHFSARKVRATSIDVSGEGTAIITQEPLTPGGQVDLVFSIPQSDQVLTLPSNVVWSTQIGQHLWKAGIHFVNPSLVVISHLLLPQ